MFFSKQPLNLNPIEFPLTRLGEKPAPAGTLSSLPFSFLPLLALRDTSICTERPQPSSLTSDDCIAGKGPGNPTLFFSLSPSISLSPKMDSSNTTVQLISGHHQPPPRIPNSGCGADEGTSTQLTESSPSCACENCLYNFHPMSSSMFNNNNSISISISDNDSDKLDRMRARVLRKRKKSSHRVNNELPRRGLRFLMKYWTFLIFLPAAGLLVFEASRIGRKPGLSEVKKPSLVENPEIGEVGKLIPGTKTKGNLNHLAPMTRVIGGVRERCLKLLPPEDLEHLYIPMGEESSSLVKKVVYISDNDITYVGGNTTLSRQRSVETRFNLFTGNQSLDQREKSFKVNKTVAVHCGFYNENGGFRFSDEDKSFMQTCKVVVSTCAFGGGDDLYQPIGMSEASLRKVCYVAFWDEVTLATQESEGHKIGEDRSIGKWRIVVVRDLPFVDQRLNGKIPKMLAHRLFPNAKYSIWVDSKSQFRRDPLGVVEALLSRSNSVLAISEHGARSSVYDEAKAVVKKHKATPEEVEVQLSQYRQDSFPEDKRFNGKKALSEASVIVREHTPLTNLFMCLWFNEVVRFTSRDQLSFPYALWRLKVLKNINMFPVCTRKDLVNSMGHIRKAKPLKS